MVRNTTATDDESAMIGKRIFSKKTHRGLGVIVGVKTERNLRGEKRRVFVTKAAPDAKPVSREVDDILRQVNDDESSYEAFDVGEAFDDVTPEDFGL